MNVTAKAYFIPFIIFALVTYLTVNSLLIYIFHQEFLFFYSPDHFIKPGVSLFFLLVTSPC